MTKEEQRIHCSPGHIMFCCVNDVRSKLKNHN